MSVKVWLLAFGEKNEFRVVEIVSENNDTISTTLGKIYRNGQNDFDPQDHPSMSAGDVVEFDSGEKWLCGRWSWKKLSDEEFTRFKSLDRLERLFHEWLDHDEVEVESDRVSCRGTHISPRLL